MKSLRKYGYVFTVGLQSALVYRWNFFIRGSFSLVHLALVFILWGAAFSGVAQMNGFDLRQTLTYFIVVLVMQFMIGAFNEDFQISEEIRNGLINQFLLKPVNYFGYRLSLFTSARLISGLLIFVPLLAASPWLIDQLTLPHDPWRVPAALVAMALAAVLQFTIAFCFGLLAFWFLEIQGFVILSYAMETFLSGAMFPLDLLPKGAFAVTQYLPDVLPGRDSHRAHRHRRGGRTWTDHPTTVGPGRRGLCPAALGARAAPAYGGGRLSSEP
jgi:ABC-2 type transport system permease protein